jgi:hypothetical protein
MNLPSLIKYEPLFSQGTTDDYTSLIDLKEASRTDIELLPVPVNEIAIGNGNPKLGNMVAWALLSKNKTGPHGFSV